MFDGHTTHTVVRIIHVLAATVLVGGAVAIALVAATAREARSSTATLIATATRYEIAFWLAFGVIVATGVGNLGAFGRGLPDVGTDWGRTLVIKLSAVVLFALFSAVRTLVAVRLSLGSASSVNLTRWYGATALLAGSVVTLAIWLAHA